MDASDSTRNDTARSQGLADRRGQPGRAALETRRRGLPSMPSTRCSLFTLSYFDRPGRCREAGLRQLTRRPIVAHLLRRAQRCGQFKGSMVSISCGSKACTESYIAKADVFFDNGV
eukprot:362836-Chlamydomonas_euryale.AAC.18